MLLLQFNSKNIFLQIIKIFLPEIITKYKIPESSLNITSSCFNTNTRKCTSLIRTQERSRNRKYLLYSFGKNKGIHNSTFAKISEIAEKGLI